MAYIKRDYLQEFIDVKDTTSIKVITGVRRSGKSTLLSEFMHYLNDVDPSVNIVYINYSIIDFESLKDYKNLNTYVEDRFVEGVDNYLIIDEVQMCDKFELVINSLHAKQQFNIYIAGSNAFMLASCLATLFTGRCDNISIYPFSLKEYMTYFSLTDENKALDLYLEEGGLSESYPIKNFEAKYKYIRTTIDDLIFKDIIAKYKIRNAGLLDRITNYMFDNIGNLVSVTNILNVLNSKNEKVSYATIENYLKYLCDAFVLYKVPSYNVKCKEYLNTRNKYYLSDHSFKLAKLGSKFKDTGILIENIVAIELIRRGYELYVGVLYNKEIDFVAIKREERLYIQVSDNISDEKTFNREVDPLLKITDGYPKLLLTRTYEKETQYEGIRIIDVASFLAEK